MAETVKLMNPRKKVLLPDMSAGCSLSSSITGKDVKLLKRFVTDQGKIMPRRVTGTSAKMHRKMVRAIKRARNIAIQSVRNQRILDAHEIKKQILDTGNKLSLIHI